jgi:hypothetical protein
MTQGSESDLRIIPVYFQKHHMRCHALLTSIYIATSCDTSCLLAFSFNLLILRPCYPGTLGSSRRLVHVRRCVTLVWSRPLPPALRSNHCCTVHLLLLINHHDSSQSQVDHFHQLATNKHYKQDRSTTPPYSPTYPTLLFECGTQHYTTNYRQYIIQVRPFLAYYPQEEVLETTNLPAHHIIFNNAVIILNQFIQKLLRGGGGHTHTDNVK